MTEADMMKHMIAYDRLVRTATRGRAVASLLNDGHEGAVERIARLDAKAALDLLTWAQRAYNDMPLLMSMLAARAESEQARRLENDLPPSPDAAVEN